MEKIIKFVNIEIQKQKLHQHKGPISIKNIGINKRSRHLIRHLIRSLLVKTFLDLLLATKILAKLNLYVYFSIQKHYYQHIFLQDLFQKLLILAFRRNRNLSNLLGCENIVDRKLQRQFKRKKIGFFTVSQNQKTYDISKFYKRNLLKEV